MSTTTDSAVIDPTGIVHCQQNANYVTPSEHYVFVHRVECLRDGGILDPDDQLFDVFDENNDQILAIYDEPNFAVVNSVPTNASCFAINETVSSSSSATTKTTISTGPSLDHKLNIISSSGDGDVVEITNIAVMPTDGLQVISDNAHALQQKPSSSSFITGSDSTSPLTFPSIQFDQKRSITSDIRHIYHSTSKNVSGSPRNKYRVIISPDVNHQSSQESSIFMKESLMVQSSSRKSRLTDNFFDAKERLEEKLANNIKSHVIKTDGRSSKLIPLMEAANREQTVIIFSDSTINIQLGIEVSPVHDPVNSMRLQAVEIRQIDNEGRVGRDGRLQVGDRIVEINQRPVYQMSISRARAYLQEIEAIAHPSLTIDRSIETFTSDAISHRSQSSTNSLQKRPTLSALQQANTTALGTTFPVKIVKKSGGFGFTITSRETAKGERLFYIGTVKADGAAVNILRAGDRLLQINGEKTTEITQNYMVERLKKLDVGDSVNLLVSRLGNQENESQNSVAVKIDHDDKKCRYHKGVNEGVKQYGEEILTLKIALNETGSAGLGISLKARAVMKPDGTRHDCGIFIKKVLHGGAAYKDGRLQLNDQLIGIENTDLRRMTKNSEASDAITRCLKNLGPNANNVCLKVARKVELRHSNDSPSIKNSFDKCLLPHYESPKVHDGSRTKSEDNDKMIVKKHGTSNDCNANMPRRQFNSSSEHSLNANEDLDSISSDRQKYISEDEMSHVDSNAFSRKNPARRSISEKRHMGVRNDANNAMLFHKIKHSHEMSASPNRRSLSLESMEAHRLSMLTTSSAHLNGLTFRGAQAEQMARRVHPNTLKRVQKSRSSVCMKPFISDAEDRTSAGRNRDESYGSLPREISATSKEKQQRRKSVGSSIFSKITQRLGSSRSRDASPEKSVSFGIVKNNFLVEKANRTQNRQEWNKKSNHLIRRAPPPPYQPSSCDILQSINPDYYVNEVSRTHKTEVLCNGEELPASGYIRVANSKFYDSFIERNKEHPEMYCLAGEDSIIQRLATTNAITEGKETHPSIVKQEMGVNYMCNLANSSSNNSNNIQSARSFVTKDDLSNSSGNVWHIIQDAETITMTPSILGLRTVQLPHAEIYLQEEEANIRSSTLTFPQQQQKQCHKAEHRYNKFTMKDSSPVQLSFTHQECERGKISKELVPITQPTMPPIFTKSVFTRPLKEYKIAENIRRRFGQCSETNQIYQNSYGSSHLSLPKQQSLRMRTVGIRSPNSDSFCQQTTDSFDYQNYLRATCRDRINDRKERIMLIATIPDKTMFMKRSDLSYFSS
ncbi:Partitioning defective protein [Dirofilaria immitis]